MMSKFLLFLCFTAVHVLGEGEKNIASKTDVPLVHTTSLQHNPKQPLETLSKVVSSVEPASTDKIETKSKPEENLTTQSFTIAPLRSTAVTPNVTNISTTSESSVEQSHVPVISEVKHAALRTTIASYDSSGKWIVNGTDKVCIIVQMAVDFNIAYTDDKNQTFHKKFDIPEDNATRATGFCGVGEQNLTLEWSSINITNASLTLHFVKNETIGDYFFHHLEIVLPAVNFGNSTLNKTKILVYEAKPNYAVGLGQSYRCMKQQKFNLKNQETSNQTSSYLIVSDLQFQAFRADKTTVFGLPKDCAFDTPDIVPIAVGCGLAALVIVVLVAYLYGRRRSQAQGYLSM